MKTIVRGISVLAALAIAAIAGCYYPYSAAFDRLGALGIYLRS